MPEGPEIRRLADRLDRILGGHIIEEVWSAFPAIQNESQRLGRRHLLRVESRGKALLSFFDEGSVIYSHNQLYGRWSVVKRGVPPVTQRSPRLRLSTARHDAWLFSASDICLLHESELHGLSLLAKLGPDPLVRCTDLATILAHIRQQKFIARQLGTLLLDQGFIAGVGNYLRSEILFFAGLMPQRRVGELCDEQQKRLAGTILSICRRAYQYAGVTNTLTWREPMIAAGLPRREWRHAVFGRASEPCHACGTPIERCTFASRRLYYCCNCQS